MYHCSSLSSEELLLALPPTPPPNLASVLGFFYKYSFHRNSLVHSQELNLVRKTEWLRDEEEPSWERKACVWEGVEPARE